MGFFDDFTKSASKVAGKAMQSAGTAMKTAVNKSSDFAEISKLKMKISAEQKAIDDLYYYIGRNVYEDCVVDGIALESVKDQCAEVYEHKNRIAELQGKIELIRGENEGAAAAEDDESEVTFAEEDEVVIEEVLAVDSTPASEDQADSFAQEEAPAEFPQEEDTQYGVLPDLDGEKK